VTVAPTNRRQRSRYAHAIKAMQSRILQEVNFESRSVIDTIALRTATRVSRSSYGSLYADSRMGASAHAADSENEAFEWGLRLVCRVVTLAWRPRRPGGCSGVGGTVSRIEYP
jgi:hypothetical protein